MQWTEKMEDCLPDQTGEDTGRACGFAKPFRLKSALEISYCIIVINLVFCIGDPKGFQHG